MGMGMEIGIDSLYPLLRLFISIRWVRAESFINERDNNDNNNNMQCTSPWYVSFHCTLTLSTGFPFMLLLLHRTSCCCCLLCWHFTEAAAREAGWVRERVREREQVQKTSETGRESACLLRFWFRCRPYQSREYSYYIDRWAIQVDMKSRNWVNAFLRWLCTLLVVVFIELFIKFCVLCKLPLCRRCICHTLKQNCFLFVFTFIVFVAVSLTPSLRAFYFALHTDLHYFFVLLLLFCDIL